MAIVGMLEGMQIAFFAVARMTDEERSQSYWAKRTCDVLFEGDGRNLPGFMVGRQMCVTLCFFIIARGTYGHVATTFWNANATKYSQYFSMTSRFGNPHSHHYRVGA